jgi:hypothetical protein
MIKKSIVLDDSKTPRKAVKKAKDINTAKLPDIIRENKIRIPNEQLPNRFGSYFDTKIKDILNEVSINADQWYTKSV